MLHFLGDGSAFNVDSNNTSAYIKKGDAMILFDCGERICNVIIKAGILDGVKRLHLFITHTHSDHIGSLEGFIYYIHYFTDIELYVYYPHTSRLDKMMRMQGLEFEYATLPVPEKVEGYRVDAVRQKHMFGAYGFFFYSGDDSFFFSGDTSTISKRAKRELCEGKIDVIYHEVSFSDSPIHTPISDLEKAFPMEIRDKVYLMHFANDSCRKAAAAKGFSVVSVEH
jgi:ribonuclease BN (tRNA processing enzyme)